jgi:hypothetical protein
MSRKVEQLVMGAFWEAADDVFQKDEYPRHTKAETEERFAHHMAFLIRGRGIQAYEHDKREASVSVRERHFKNRTAVAVAHMEAMVTWCRTEGEKAKDAEHRASMYEFAGLCESRARELRKLLEGL